MPAHLSDPEDLTLHGPRVLGFASGSRIAARFGIDRVLVDEALLDFEARGWVRRSSFAGTAGWSLTEPGRLENERRLSRELDDAGARDAVTAVHAEFIPLNRRFGRDCTDWQIRPTRADPLSFNDHTDCIWDERVTETLRSLDAALGRLCTRLAERLQRLDGYADRYSTALARVDAGELRWVDAPEVDSCHTVWIQLHEDLLATVGKRRGSDT